jgi:hypothetical protein
MVTNYKIQFDVIDLHDILNAEFLQKNNIQISDAIHVKMFTFVVVLLSATFFIIPSTFGKI